MAGQVAGTRSSRRPTAARCPPSTVLSSPRSPPSTAAASTSSSSTPSAAAASPSSMLPTDRGSRDPHRLDALITHVLSTCIHAALPSPAVSVHGRLRTLLDSDAGGADRLSGLPDALLRDIVSRLPVKDGARTAVLSRRWRPVWRAAPLVLYDAHLLPGAKDDEIPTHVKRADEVAVVAAVSRVLDAHGGPFRCAYLTCSNMDGDQARVARWLQLLAVKGVEELFLINRPPLQLDRNLPATFFSMAGLTRLYLCFLRFPITAGLPRGAAFPSLRELGLCSVAMEGHGDMDFILARSPVLETLCFEGHIFPPLRFRVVSRSLRSVQIHYSKVKSIAVVDAPCLVRLIVMNTPLKSEGSCRIKIVNAPSLHLYGYFDPVRHALHVGDNDISKAATLVNARGVVPSVKILALDFHFRVRNDAKMLPSFLRCFPNVERMYIHSKKVNEPTGKLNFKFWQEAGAIECVESHVKLLVFHDFRGENSELAFLKFFVESARVLEKLVIVCTNGSFSSMDEANSKVKKTLFAGKKGSERCALLVLEAPTKEEAVSWTYNRGFDFSNVDPFAYIVPA